MSLRARLLAGMALVAVVLVSAAVFVCDHLRALAAQFRVRSMLVMGDDQTDVAMFREAIRMRDEGLTVITAGVSGDGETPAEIEHLSDIFLQSTEEAREMLDTLADALKA